MFCGKSEQFGGGFFPHIAVAFTFFGAVRSGGRGGVVLHSVIVQISQQEDFVAVFGFSCFAEILISAEDQCGQKRDEERKLFHDKFPFSG